MTKRLFTLPRLTLYHASNRLYFLGFPSETAHLTPPQITQQNIHNSSVITRGKKIEKDKNVEAR